MEKNIDIAALGELLIDFTEAGTGAEQVQMVCVCLNRIQVELRQIC